MQCMCLYCKRMPPNMYIFCVLNWCHPMFRSCCVHVSPALYWAWPVALFLSCRFAKWLHCWGRSLNTHRWWSLPWTRCCRNSSPTMVCCPVCVWVDCPFFHHDPWREAGDFWCLLPVWNLRIVSLVQLFCISSFVLPPSPVALSVLYWIVLYSYSHLSQSFQINSKRLQGSNLWSLQPMGAT